jgi:hypothetical protein
MFILYYLPVSLIKAPGHCKAGTGGVSSDRQGTTKPIQFNRIDPDTFANSHGANLARCAEFPDVALRNLQSLGNLRICQEVPINGRGGGHGCTAFARRGRRVMSHRSLRSSARATSARAVSSACTAIASTAPQ